ncbi:hypothetical protein [Actinomadura flavalba]|uniref:hypothetical protein n=1 Tax=Actinomadura flavalba TaxID=1120938 RepID=UPI0003671BF7|nr:hypothetical protein [Actinomadura flavalba]
MRIIPFRRESEPDDAGREDGGPGEPEPLRSDEHPYTPIVEVLDAMWPGYRFQVDDAADGCGWVAYPKDYDAEIRKWDSLPDLMIALGGPQSASLCDSLHYIARRLTEALSDHAWRTDVRILMSNGEDPS